MPYRLGVDIGGTFTDLALQNCATGVVTTTKHATTAHDPVQGITEALPSLLAREEAGINEVIEILHATTLATNTVLQRSGPKVGLLTTSGFRDILFLQRQKRYELYDYTAPMASPIVEGTLVAEIDERIGASGEVVKPLKIEDVLTAGSELVKNGAESLAVAFINSFMENAHERLALEMLTREYPTIRISASHEVAPVIREYERFSTTVMNAYVMPAVASYLDRLELTLAKLGYNGRLFMMQSSGGFTTLDLAKKYPVRLIESGPAAGVVSATATARRLDIDQLLSFDMGGTTAKVALVENQRPSLTHLFEVDRRDMKDGTGLPVLAPAVDLVEIGAGGGSIASVHLGMVEVGPKSAGADPGPACYGKGGEHPTVTDADVVLGLTSVLHADFESIPLDREAAIRSVDRWIAAGLDVSTLDASSAVHAVVTANMARAARLVTVERGKEVSTMTLFAIGGAGPVHAAALAESIGIRNVVIPPDAGTNSAIGLLEADALFSFAVSRPTRVEKEDSVRVGESVKEDLKEKAETSLASLGVDKNDCTYAFSADMRYVGQGHEVSVDFDWPADPTSLPKVLKRRFSDVYRDLYGINAHGEIEVITWELNARWQRDGYIRPKQQPKSAPSVPSATRKASFGSSGPVETAVYQWPGPGTEGPPVVGPAIIEQVGSTIVVPPGWEASLDSDQNIHLRFRKSIGTDGASTDDTYDANDGDSI